MTSAAAVLLPVFVEIALTFGLLLWSGFLRVGAVRSGAVHQRDIALRQLNWPRQAQQVSNAYQNQLELPVLFYVLMVLTLVTATASTAMVALAWLFVALRLLHALVHVTTNRVGRRFFIFLAGALVLILMWLLFAAEILFGV